MEDVEDLLSMEDLDRQNGAGSGHGLPFATGAGGTPPAPEAGHIAELRLSPHCVEEGSGPESIGIVSFGRYRYICYTMV